MANNDFVRIFSISSGKYYVYEGLTGKILRVAPQLYGDAPGAEAAAIRAHLQRHPLTPQRELDAVKWEMDFPLYLRTLEGGIAHLVLQTTCRCNLDCKYCVYSGNYIHMQPHSDQTMSESCMRRSIDFFAAHNREADRASISFYGGEPLLCMALLKKAVAYGRQAITGKPLDFQISTNGVLLTKPVMAWLQENPDVNVTVTLNGPFQDRYRVMVSGEGSLGRIMNNLSLLREAYPDVWEHQISFIANVAGAWDLEELGAFYRTEVGKAPSHITSIHPQNGNEVIRSIIAEEDILRSRRGQIQTALGEEYCRTQDPVLHAWFRAGLRTVESRLQYHDWRIGRIKSCLPGAKKLFVFSDGTFGLCESACDKLRVGDLDRGFETEALRRLYDGASALYNKKCRRCWAQRLCRACLALVIDADGTLMEEVPGELCEKICNSALRDLKIFCEIKDREAVNYGSTDHHER